MERDGAISENFLAQVWQQQLAGRDPMVTTGGDTVEVLHPGRPTHDCGPDFRDALIVINGRPPLQGDVELHVNARDWRAHGHHRDPNYDRVILHVALRSDGTATSPLCSGRAVPVLALFSSLSGSTEELRSQLYQPPFGEEPCYQAFLRYGEDDVTQAVEEAGDERFRQKAQCFEAALATREAGQVLYEGFMRALGYSQNKEPFQRLARLLPLSTLDGLAKRGDHAQIRALMLGTAGLLPSQRCVGDGGLDRSGANETGIGELERMWISSGRSQAMKVLEWRFNSIRPENLPTRRIVAASYLLARHQGTLLQGILPTLNRLSLPEIQHQLERALMVRVGGYWASHVDFGIASGWRPTLIGQSRARDIIVNVVLPFCFAWAQITGRDWVQSLSVDLYCSHPGLEENWITRHMKAKVFGNGAARMVSARQQQGLIQIHETFCMGHRCHDCPLGGGHATCHSQPAGTGDFFNAEAAE